MRKTWRIEAEALTRAETDPPKGAYHHVMLVEDALQEIEKARRLNGDDRFLESRVRADEGERMVRRLRHLYDEQSALQGNGTCKGIAIAIDCILHSSSSNLPEHVIGEEGPKWTWNNEQAHIINAIITNINDILRRLNEIYDILRRLNEISPGNRP